MQQQNNNVVQFKNFKYKQLVKIFAKRHNKTEDIIKSLIKEMDDRNYLIHHIEQELHLFFAFLTQAERLKK